MSQFARFRSWLTWMMKRSHLEREMDAELRFHIESFARDLIQNGAPEQEAMRRARVEFGGIESHKNVVRASLGLRRWDELWVDLRYALRMIRRSPGFTAVAVLSLALGVCANTTIFSAINTLLFRRLPYQDSDRVVAIWNHGLKEDRTQLISTGDLANWRKQNAVFDQIEATNTFASKNVLVGPNGSERVGIQYVTPGRLDCWVPNQSWGACSCTKTQQTQAMLCSAPPTGIVAMGTTRRSLARAFSWTLHW